MKINMGRIGEYKSRLENHSLLVTNSIQTVEDLKTFMQTHVYAVWDFMSLLKTLQHEVVPSGNLWLPSNGNRHDIARLINQIVLCEESDIDIGNDGGISHFDLYLQAMLEVGADVTDVLNFIQDVSDGMIPTHPSSCATPAARRFMTTTFDMIQRGPHCVAASFAYGRETVIPSMFTRILNQLNISNLNAPKFHYYLERHIEVDGDEHGPMSERLVQFFCKDDPVLVHEAELAAIDSIKARIQLFDEIELMIS